MEISQLETFLEGKIWTDEERDEFGKRLTAARMSKYPFAPAAIEAINRLHKIQRRTYYSHESGSRFPGSAALILVYCHLFNVRAEYLLLLEDRATDKAEPPAKRINQVLERLPFYASSAGDTLYIPRLTASDIRDLLTGQLDLATFAGGRFPVPKHVAAGPMTFEFQIPQGDMSMVGTDGPPFFPGSHLIIDPERETAPGEYLLCLPAGAKNPLPRRLQSRFPYTPDAPRYPFKLIAASPYAEAIEVHSADDCAILGRIIFVGQTL